MTLRKLFFGVMLLFPSFIQEGWTLRCYDCLPGSGGYSISGSSTGSGSGSYGSPTASSSTDCYSPDTRQIKDCPWDIQNCYTVVLPGPQSNNANVAGLINGLNPIPSNSNILPASGGTGSMALPHQAQTIHRGCGRSPFSSVQEVGQTGQFGVSQNIPYGNPYTINSGLVVQRGCGKYPGVYEVGDEECRVITLPGTTTRATVCNCRSDSCNSKRPDQVQNPLLTQSNIPTGFYPNAPPSIQPGPGFNQVPLNTPPQYPPPPGYNSYPAGMYGPGSPYAQPGGAGMPYNTGQYAYGSGYYGSQQPGAQYPYPSTAYGPQQQPAPGYYPPPQGNYPGYIPVGQGGMYSQQAPGVNQYGVNYAPNDPYSYQARYGGASGLVSSKPSTVMCMALSLLLLAAALAGV